jgi:hypothetical protein
VTARLRIQRLRFRPKRFCGDLPRRWRILMREIAALERRDAQKAAR